MKRWAVVVVAFAAGPALAQQATMDSPGSSLGVYAYPLEKQTPEQQRDDETQCFAWARNKTGVDPMAQSTTPPPTAPPGATPGAGASGAARGAAGGAVVGAMTGSVGRGAAIGSAVGAAGRRSASRQANAAAQAEQQRQHAETTTAQRQEFNKAFTACMSGRGYSVQ